jgi:hypothetical protein
MLKISFTENTTPYLDINYTDDYIPFVLKFISNTKTPSTIYARCFSNETLIEFRFNEYTKSLYEITLVSFNPNSIVVINNEYNYINDNCTYNCLINEEKSNFILSNSIQITAYINAIQLDIIGDVKYLTTYYKIAENCFIGINEDNFLVSLLLTDLSNNQVQNILG